MLESFFRISEIGLEIETGVSDQLIEAWVVAPFEAESKGRPAEKSETSLEAVNFYPHRAIQDL